jgi:protein-tyrosine phosphatase
MKIYSVIFMLTILPDVVGAQQRQVSEREVALEGAVNFRDLGGYTTTDYRRLSMGRIYRAGDISKLSDADMEELKRRKIYTVVDFRSEEEATAAPDRLLPGADYLRLAVGSGNPADFFKGRTSGSEAMIAFYSDISVFKEKYRPFFRKLLMLPDTSAIVFHCSAGKDRTGIAAALLLYALDIPIETILADYAATNYFRRKKKKKIINHLVNDHGIDHQIAVEFMDANPLYLESAFNALKRKYGSVDLFLYRDLGMDEAAKFRLREQFLQ